MVLIPSYNERSRAVGVRVDPAQGAAFGEALQGVGQAVSQYAEKRIAQQEHDDFTAAKNELRKFGIQRDREVKALQGGEARGSAESFQKDWNKQVQSVSSRFGGRVGEAISQWGSEKSLSFLSSHAAHEDAERRAQGAAEHALEWGIITEELEASGDLLAARAAREESIAMAVSAGHILPEQGERMLVESYDKDANTAFDVLYTSSPNEAIESIDSFGLDPIAKEKKIERYRADVEAAKREQERIDREQARVILDRSAGQEIIALETNDTNALRQDAEALRLLGFDREASSIEKTASAIDQSYSARIIDASKPLSVVEKEISDMSVGSDPENAVVLDSVRGQRVKAFKQRLDAFLSDPALFVSGEVQGETGEERASSSLSLQAAQGYNPKGGFRVLSNTERAGYKQSFEAGNTSQRVELVNGLKDEYGIYADQVLGEIGVPAGAMLSTYTETEHEQSILMRAGTEKIETPAGMFDADIKLASDSSEIIATMEAARVIMPTDRSYSEYYSGMRKTIENVCRLVGDAEDGASWIEERFGTINADSAKVIFPSSVIDEDTLEESLDKKREEFKASFLYQRDADDRARWAIENAVWINDGDGVSLIDVKTGMRFAGSKYNFAELR